MGLLFEYDTYCHCHFSKHSGFDRRNLQLQFNTVFVKQCESSSPFRACWRKKPVNKDHARNENTQLENKDYASYGNTGIDKDHTNSQNSENKIDPFSSRDNKIEVPRTDLLAHMLDQKQSNPKVAEPECMDKHPLLTPLQVLLLPLRTHLESHYQTEKHQQQAEKMETNLLGKVHPVIQLRPTVILWIWCMFLVLKDKRAGRVSMHRQHPHCLWLPLV